MFRKRMLKTIALTLALSLCSLFTASVSADSPDPENLEESYIVTYQAEEITDTQELYQLALSKSTLSAEQDPYDFTSHQLLERREYKDGHVEEDYCASNLLVLDEKGSRMSRATTYENGWDSDSGDGPTGIAAVHKMYYSFYNSNPNNPAYGQNYVKLTKITTQVTNRPSRTSITHGYRVQDDLGARFWSDEKTIGNATQGTIYSLSSKQNVDVATTYVSGMNSWAEIYPSEATGSKFTLSISSPWNQ